MPDNDRLNGREELLITNAILKAQIEFSKMLDEKLKALAAEFRVCFRDLPCDEHDKAIEKTNGNLRTLIIVLVATGVLGGSTFGILKAILGGP